MHFYYRRIQKMKITALLENTSSQSDMQTEHGLSLYIEAGGHRMLFDMGQTDLFLKNAEKLGIDLSLVTVAVLSHGHYDHGGGLSEFFKINSTAPVYVSRHAFGDYFNASGKYIGLDHGLAGSERLRFTDGITRICDGLTLYPSSVIAPDSFAACTGLTEKIGGETVPDSFLHEQYLMIETDRRRVLISGCSHKGIAAITGYFRPDVLVGGFHFSKLPLDDTLDAASRKLDAFPTQYYTCHCTGTAQYEFMRKRMMNLRYLACGDTLII